uniref:Uncharacterized protein n=1 Tax=Ditylenchus dipsaci TaxID=166011 RepID=A0A915E6E2_9BILA
MSANRKRNVIITPFNGDHTNFAKYKSSVIDFVKNYFIKVLGADQPGIQSVQIWKDRPTATVAFCEES